MSTSRFDRNYELTMIFPEGEKWVVKPPVRIRFQASEGVSGFVPNNCAVWLYNLNPGHVLALERRNDEQKSTYINFSLKVGYKDMIGQVFQGNLFLGSTSCEGPDLITYIKSQDGQWFFANREVNATVTTRKQGFQELIKDTKLQIGKISVDEKLTKPLVLKGKAAEVLKGLVNKDEVFYIKDEKIYVLQKKEYIPYPAVKVTTGTGLLNVPTIDNGIITFQTVLNPLLRLGGLVDLRSSVMPKYSGIYSVDSIATNGDTHGNEWTQKVTGRLSDQLRAAP